MKTKAFKNKIVNKLFWFDSLVTLQYSVYYTISLYYMYYSFLYTF